MTPDIRLHHLRKTYGSGESLVVALHSLDLTVPRGDFLAIMGPSGSGKSTCMNIIGFLDSPSSGSFSFRDVAVESLSRQQRAVIRRNYLGFVFQGFNLLGRTTALENVELPLVYRGLKAAERRERAMAALASVGLQGREGHTPAELSGGQQQRVAIARAIVTDPLILLADEPTGNLDSQRSAEIMTILTGLNRDKGITVIIVTHEPEIAASAKRIITFRDGELVSEQHREAP